MSDPIVEKVVARLRSGYCERGYDRQYPPGEIFVCRRCESGSIAPNIDGDDKPLVIVGNACPDCAKPWEETAEYEAWRSCRTGMSFSLRPSSWKVHGTQTGRWPFVG